MRVERVRYMVASSKARVIEALAEQEAVLMRDPARIADELHTRCVRTRDAVTQAVRDRFGEQADGARAATLRPRT